LERHHDEEHKSILYDRANKKLYTEDKNVTQAKQTDFMTVQSNFRGCLLQWMIAPINGFLPLSTKPFMK
jgi:hypothetical protein